MTQQTTNVRLKLLIDKETRSVLYGEADKDFIDFLFNLLSLPLGAVIKLLNKQHMIGCLGNLYESVETLNETFFIQPTTQTKQTLLNPKISLNCSTKLLPYTIETSTSLGGDALSSTPSSCRPLPFPWSNSSFDSSGSFSLSTFDIQRQIGDCSKTSSSSSSDGDGRLKVGFVKGLATYIVMDDLTVKHVNDLSIVSIFKKFNIKDADALEEKVITLNVDEGVELLRASLQSKMVPTDVFLRRERQIIDNYNGDEDKTPQQKHEDCPSPFILAELDHKYATRMNLKSKNTKTNFHLG